MQVSLVACEECTFLSWDASALRNSLRRDQFLKNVFNSLIGQDVTSKLLHLDRNIEGDTLQESSAIVYQKQHRAASSLNSKFWNLYTCLKSRALPLDKKFGLGRSNYERGIR